MTPAKATATKSKTKTAAKKPAAKKPAAKKPAVKKSAAKNSAAESAAKNGAADKPRVARPAWQGSISFGLIHFPVKLFGVSRSKRIAFNQLHREDGARIKQKRFCAKEDVEVPYEEIVRGYEISPGKYVVIEPAELEEIAPTRSKSVELEKFIDLGEVDPLFYDASYFVLPGDDAEGPYALLREAMLAENKAAVARFVMRGKEHLVCLWPREDVLILSTMHFADEISDPEKFDAEDPPNAKRKAAEVTAARQLIAALADDFDINDYKDEYREQVLALIDAKAKGKKFAITEEAEDLAPAKDLMAALEESLASLSGTSSGARKRGSAGKHRAKGRTKH